ncbi:hypothetical protein MMC10_009010 [Thelotrema lepadinum]|nr:hypothetical protein [Thelotrema lepadinum]
MTEPSKTQDKSTLPIRRFAVQPVETTSKSHRVSKSKPENAEASESPRRRFAPQLEETSETTHRKGGKQVSTREDAADEMELEAQSAASGTGARRFAPQLVETAKRSRKRGDTTPATQHTDKTDLSPGDKIHLPRHIRIAQSSSPERPAEKIPRSRSSESIPQSPESRFSFANLSKKTPRQASFRVPQLEPIASPEDSEDSNESNMPSLSTTPSAISDVSEMQRQARRLRESCDEKFSGYLLNLAARAAERQLQEQALAAFPNERFNEPVNHFAYKRESEHSDDEDTEIMSESFDVADAIQRRMSATGWDVIEMQKHKEKLEEQRRKQKIADADAPKREDSVNARDPWKSPFDLNAIRQVQPEKHLGGNAQDPGELTKMRSAASPPMLGQDLEFPKTQSPQQTMIDATQRPRSRRKASGEPVSRQHSGLWTPAVSGSPVLTRQNSVTSPCLWGGFCNAPENKDTSNSFLCVPRAQQQTGIMAPKAEGDDPFSSASPSHVLPSSANLGGLKDEPPALASIDAILTTESALDTEYPDTFVTQLYNYLSLGYPALARKFDSELSKISQIPIEDIRRGDGSANAKGFVDTPEGEGWEEEDIREKCGRWCALRLYVREWSRQQPRMAVQGEKGGMWGATGRRGSWAI